MAQTVVAPASSGAPEPRRWTVEEFDRIPPEIFGEDEHVELIDGLIYTKMPQGLPRISALRAVFAALLDAYGRDFTVSMQLPTMLDPGNKPEPDIMVMPGSWRSYDMRYPDPRTEIALVVEVSDTSLAFDLRTKLAMYAASGVPEYWILDLTSRALQVCRQPEGNAYAETFVAREGESVTANGKAIAVADLLPRAEPGLPQ